MFKTKTFYFSLYIQKKINQVFRRFFICLTGVSHHTQEYDGGRKVFTQRF